MYAIIETGGKQYRVKPGDTIAVERLTGEPGETLDLGRVLLVSGDGGETRVGAPAVDGAVVRAEVVEQGRGVKLVIFRYKSKVRYRRKTGHRQSLTRLKITDIMLDGASTAARDAAAEEVSETPARRRRPTPAETPAAVASEEPAAVADESTEVTDMPASAGEGGPDVQAAAADAESEATKE